MIPRANLVTFSLPQGAARCACAPRTSVDPAEGLVSPGPFRELYGAAPNGLT